MILTFEELEDVPRSRLHHPATKCRHRILDVGLRWPRANGLDHHDVEGRRERLGHSRVARLRPPNTSRRGGGADQHAVVARVVVDPRAVMTASRRSAC